ncbi:MAG: ABC transporter ATP-binding protein [Saprospiraceae bacterium]|nr:ABC transporter ATP-binding protein [Saprospiraceae bacterium]
MIEIKNLKKIYGSVAVVNIPELKIGKGESFGLVGNNGAGKTTLFRMILDLVRPNSGYAKSKDINVRESEEWKKYTGSYLDESFLIDFLTPEEYFEFIGNLHGMSKGDVSEFIGKFEDIFHDEITGKKKYIRELSKGNQKKVGIVASLLANPEIIVLDEPFANLDPSTNIKLIKLLRKIKEEKKITMLISSHDLNHITEVCDRICVLDKGKIVHDIETNEHTLKTLEEYFSVHGD